MPLLLGGGATGVGAGAGAGAGGAGAAGAEPVVVVGADVEEDEEVVGVEDDDEPDPELLDEAEDEDPAEVDPDVPVKLDEPAVKALVVVPTFFAKAFDPPHPVMEKLAMVSAAIVHKPCGFSLIVTFGRSVTGCQVKVGGHLLWIYRARAVADYRIALKSKRKFQSSTLVRAIADACVISSRAQRTISIRSLNSGLSRDSSLHSERHARRRHCAHTSPISSALESSFSHPCTID